MNKVLKELTIEEAKLKSNHVLWIDMRSKIAYEHGHIPGAVSLPEPFDYVEIAKLLREADAKRAILYCSIGERSRQIAWDDVDKEIEVFSLKGGYREWLIYCEEHLSEAERLQYSRQIALPELGILGQEKLKNARVLVIGAGALGTVALTYLAAAGIGCLGIAEGDIIDASNLHRQILYDRNDIGKPKIRAAKERLQKTNPFINIILHETFATPDNIMEIVQGYDFVVDATDRIETKFLVNDACVLAKVPFCHAGVLAFEGQVMTWIPGENPCYRCIFGDVPADYIPNCAETGILGAMAGVIGSVQALEAIKYISGIGDLLVGKMFHFDGMKMKTRIINLPPKADDCMVCGTHAIITNVSENKSRYAIRGCSLEGR